MNGIPMTAQPILKEITVKEWGVNGIIVTDAGALDGMVRGHNYYLDLPTAAAGGYAEPGQLSPRNLGEEPDLSAAEFKAPQPRVLGAELGCPGCEWHGAGASYAAHWKTAHAKPN